MIRKLLCRLFAHRWRYPRDFIRECPRCEREEAVYLNRFPKIGEPQTEWRASPNQRLRDGLETME